MAQRPAHSSASNILSVFLKKLKALFIHPVAPVLTTIRVTSGQVTPTTISGLGQTLLLTADVRDQFNHTMTTGFTLFWVSSDVAVAQIQAPSGRTARLFSLAAGSVTVTASAQVVISPDFPVDVIVTPVPPTQTKIIGLSGSLTFGSVLVGTTPTATLNIANAGNASLTVTSITYPTGFSGSYSGVIAAGASQNVTVTFAPVAAVSYSGTVTVNSDATSGLNTTGASGTGTAATTRIISLSGSLAFGSINVGATSTRTLTITNNGSATLTVSGITYPSGFTGAYSGTIAAGGSQNVSVVFTPVAATSYGGTVTVASNKTSGTNTTTATGLGIQPQPPAGNVLGPANLVYKGCIRMPNAGTNTTFNYGGISGRKVGIQTRLFITGNVVDTIPNPPNVYELDVTGLTPNPNPTLAPRCTLVTNWGDITHGKRQSWSPTPPFAQQDLTGLQALPFGLYFHEGLQQLFWAYAYQYIVTAPWSVGFSTLDNPNTSASTAYGPFKFVATDSVAQRVGGRSHWFTLHPTTGKLLMSGSTANISDSSYGPTLFGDADWPTTSTTGGEFMTAIPLNGKYLTYYYSSFPAHGTVNNPLKTFQYDGVLTYIFEYAPAQAATRVDPLLHSGIGTSGGQDNFHSTFWFEGVNRRGVLFFGTLDAAPSSDPADGNASHEWYDNPGQMGMDLSGVVGVFTNNEAVTGGTSGASASVVTYDAGTPAIAVSQSSSLVDFTVGETITGGSSGAHATVTYFRRNDPVCAHGFPPATSGITGPVRTASRPVIIIFDPAKLEAVKAGTTVDYETRADYIIDAQATYGIVTGAQNVSGGAKALSGCYFDAATNRLYLNANRADITRFGSQVQEALIHVFEILDT